MKIDFKQEVTTIRGESYKDKPTLGDLVVEMLLAPSNELSGQEKFKRYKLATKVENGEDLDIEEANLVKESLGKHPHPAVVGVCWDMLEGI